MHRPAGPQRGATSPSLHGWKSRRRSSLGRGIGWRRGLCETQQSRSLVHGTGSNHAKVQPSSGRRQSQLGPTSTGSLKRRPSATPPSSATQRPPARSTTQARGSQRPVGGGGVCGFRVQLPATHAQVPGGGVLSSQAAGGRGSTQRVGTQGSSQPQSASLLQVTAER